MRYQFNLNKLTVSVVEMDGVMLSDTASTRTSEAHAVKDCRCRCVLWVLPVSSLALGDLHNEFVNCMHNRSTVFSRQNKLSQIVKSDKTYNSRSSHQMHSTASVERQADLWVDLLA